MGSLGILADVLILGATIKILNKSTEPLRKKDKEKEENKSLGLFDRW